MIKSIVSLLSLLAIGSVIPPSASHAAAVLGKDGIPLDDGKENEEDLDTAIDDTLIGDNDVETPDPDDEIDGEDENASTDEYEANYNQSDEAIVNAETFNNVAEEEGGTAPLPEENYE